MAEIHQDLSSSTSEDNVESSTSSDNKIQSFADEVLPYQNEATATSSDSDNAINALVNVEEGGDED